MSQLISKAKIALLAWWMAIAYIALFSIQALSIAIIGAMKDDASSHRLVTICVILNTFTTTMLAFITQAFGKIKQYEHDDSGANPAGEQLPQPKQP